MGVPRARTAADNGSPDGDGAVVLIPAAAGGDDSLEAQLGNTLAVNARLKAQVMEFEGRAAAAEAEVQRLSSEGERADAYGFALDTVYRILDETVGIKADRGSGLSDDSIALLRENAVAHRKLDSIEKLLDEGVLVQSTRQEPVSNGKRRTTVALRVGNTIYEERLFSASAANGGGANEGVERFPDIVVREIGVALARVGDKYRGSMKAIGVDDYRREISLAIGAPTGTFPTKFEIGETDLGGGIREEAPSPAFFAYRNSGGKVYKRDGDSCSADHIGNVALNTGLPGVQDEYTALLKGHDEPARVLPVTLIIEPSGSRVVWGELERKVEATVPPAAPVTAAPYTPPPAPVAVAKPMYAASSTRPAPAAPVALPLEPGTPGDSTPRVRCYDLEMQGRVRTLQAKHAGKEIKIGPLSIYRTKGSLLYDIMNTLPTPFCAQAIADPVPIIAAASGLGTATSAFESHAPVIGKALMAFSHVPNPNLAEVYHVLALLEAVPQLRAEVVTPTMQPTVDKLYGLVSAYKPATPL